MTITFNFTKLKNVYCDALNSDDKTLAFDIKIGKGKFLFIMLLGSSDKNAKDNLYIYMRNTNVLKVVKLYGSHKNGDFKMYINDELKQKFIDELQLIKRTGTFDFSIFLNELNNAIPLKVDIKTKIKTLRKNKNVILKLNAIDEVEKSVLVGVKNLSVGTPQEKTLRKLYIHTDVDPEIIPEFIHKLKITNTTLAWTTPDRKEHAFDINKYIQEH